MRGFVRQWTRFCARGVPRRHASSDVKQPFVYRGKLFGGTSCASPCGECPRVGSCWAPRAMFRPTPIWAWALLGMSCAVPMVVALFPRSFVRWYTGGLFTLPTEERLLRYHKVMDRVGIPEDRRPLVIEANDVGPFVLGSTHLGESVVFVPRQLADFSDPNLWLSFEGPEGALLYEGVMGDMTDADRARLLEHGVLVPSEEEFNFVLGHEFVHVHHNHVLWSFSLTLGAAGMAHVALKTIQRLGQTARLGGAARERRARAYGHRWRRLGWSWARRIPARMSAVSHAAIMMGTAGAMAAGIGLAHERDADVSSATLQHLEQAAVSLTTKKVQQNLAVRQRDAAAWHITPSGNDVLEWEHWPLTMQRAYMTQLWIVANAGGDATAFREADTAIIGDEEIPS